MKIAIDIGEFYVSLDDIVRRSSISRRRLEQAREMLRTSDAPSKKLVENYGVSNALHLCHISKKSTGLMPMD